MGTEKDMKTTIVAAAGVAVLKPILPENKGTAIATAMERAIREASEQGITSAEVIKKMMMEARAEAKGDE